MTVNLKYIVVNNHSGDEGSAYPVGKPIIYHAPESPARIAGDLDIKCCNAPRARIIYGKVHKQYLMTPLKKIIQPA